jgi:trimeric autotransporter adhesin
MTMNKLSTRLLAALAGSLLLVGACGDDGGDDDNVTPDANPNSPDAPVSSVCPDHPNVAEMSGVCAITGGQNAPVTDDLTLSADVDWLLNGPVFIGDDTNETVLTIPAGTTIFGGDGSFLVVQRSSKLMVNGTASAPVVMTSAKAVGSRGPEDWGGLILNGRATINNGDANGEAPGEAGSGTYGGDDDDDNSGTIRYLRVEYTGNKVDAENELNGFALQGVGSGTTLEYIQIHMASDDGIEFFGGTVSVKYLVVTGSDDDSIDWTGGWTGNIQFAVAEQLPGSGPDAERGIEADNLEGNHSATPMSRPILSNLTLISRAGNSADGVILRRGTGALLYNSIITGFGGECIEVRDPESLANITSGDLDVDNLVLDCDGGDFHADSAGLATGATIESADPGLTGWMPGDSSPALGIGTTSATGSFFTSVDYAGAFDGTTNWADGWTTDAAN